MTFRSTVKRKISLWMSAVGSAPRQALNATTADSDWLLETFAGLAITETLASDQEIVPISGVTAMTACDTSGNCHDSDGDEPSSELSIILEPTTGTALPNYDPVVVSGQAFSHRLITSVSLYVNGEFVGSQRLDDAGPTTTGSWSIVWTPPAGTPSFSLHAYVFTEDWDGTGNIFTSDDVIASAETIVTAPPLSIEKTVTPSSLISQGRHGHLHHRRGQQHRSDRPDGAWSLPTRCPTVVSGSDLSATVDLAVGEAVTYTIPATVTADLFTVVTNTAYLSHETTSLVDSASFFSCAETI